MKEIKELTGLRWIAALWVFLFHLQLKGVVPEWDWRINNVIGQGAMGVVVFFILSGVVLLYSHSRRQKIPFVPFMQKRVFRIAPVYLAGLLASLVAVLVLHVVPQQLGVLFLLNLTFLNAWIPSLAMEWYGSGGWSLGCEMLFYSCTPPLILLFARWSQRTLIVLLLSMFIVGALPGLFSAIHPELHLFNWVYSFPPARLPEYIAGMLLAVLVFRFGWQVPAWLGAAALVMLLGYLAYRGPLLGGWVCHNWLVLPALVLFIGSLLNEKKSILFSWLGSGLFTYLGKLSYGFYIWQIVLMIVLDALKGRGQLPQGSVSAMAALFVINLAVSALSYHLLENPAHKWLSKR